MNFGIMKNKLFVLAGLMMTCMGTQAQNYFGLTAGYNLSSRHVSSVPAYFVGVDYGPRSGFNAGIAYEHRFAAKTNGGNWFIDADLLFSLERVHSQSWGFMDPHEYNVSIEVEPWDEVYDTKYLKLPVGTGFNFKCTDKFGFAPKVFVILEKELEDHKVGTEKVFDVAYGGGVNLNIGDRTQIGLGYDWNNFGQGTGAWSGNAHANFTYYIFSK